MGALAGVSPGRNWGRGGFLLLAVGLACGCGGASGPAEPSAPPEAKPAAEAPEKAELRVPEALPADPPLPSYSYAGLCGLGIGQALPVGHVAAFSGGDLGAARRLVAEDRRIVYRHGEQKRWTPLHWAAYKGHLEVVRLLIAKGADVNDRGLPGAVYIGGIDRYQAGLQTPLTCAAAAGHAEVVKELIGAGAAASLADQFGLSPLHHAAWNGHAEVLRLLLDAKADVGARCRLPAGGLDARPAESPPWSTPAGDWNAGPGALHLAARAGHPEAVRLLLARGACAHARDGLGRTPLHDAAGGSDAAGKVVALLLAAGVDVNAEDGERHTPLYFAVLRRHSKVEAQLRAAGARLGVFDELHRAEPEKLAAVLKDRPALVNARGPGGQTLLRLAAERGRKDLIDVLIAHGADPEIADYRGFTPLAAALSGNSWAVAEHLLSKGASVTPDCSSASPLHFAVMGGSAQIVKMLLDKGAPVDARGPGGGLSPLHMAADRGQAEIVKLLLDAGADPNLLDGSKRTPLHLAVGRRAKEVIALLLAARTDLNVRDYPKMSPLFVALNRGDGETARQLLEAGADPNLAGEHGVTPLHLAVGRCDAGMVELLLARGARVNQPDGRGSTPLHRLAEICSANKADEVVELLLKAGADTAARDGAGQTPLDVARARFDRWTEADRLLRLLGSGSGRPAEPKR